MNKYHTISKEILEKNFQKVSSQYEVFETNKETDLENNSYNIIIFTNLHYLYATGKTPTIAKNEINKLIDNNLKIAFKSFKKNHNEELKNCKHELKTYSDIETHFPDLTYILDEFENDNFNDNEILLNLGIKYKENSVVIYSEVNWDYPYFRDMDTKNRNVTSKEITITENFHIELELTIAKIIETLL